MAKSNEKIRASERKFVALCDLVKHLAVCVIVGILGWHTITMFTAALQAKPETLTAFASCLKSWNLMEVLLGLVSAVTGCGWFFEHKRNNHLVEKEGKLRHEKESGDPINSRSGLDAKGATPQN